MTDMPTVGCTNFGEFANSGNYTPGKIFYAYCSSGLSIVGASPSGLPLGGGGVTAVLSADSNYLGRVGLLLNLESDGSNPQYWPAYLFLINGVTSSQYAALSSAYVTVGPANGTSQAVNLSFTAINTFTTQSYSTTLDETITEPTTINLTIPDGAPPVTQLELTMTTGSAPQILSIVVTFEYVPS
jgi:hypothetical protein